MASLDALGADLSAAAQRTTRSPEEVTAACTEVLGGVHRFEGDRQHYDDPQNSMLDVVLERRRGLPILLSVVYIEAARRAGIALSGVGLPGHFVVGHFGADPPRLLDPFDGGGADRLAVPGRRGPAVDPSTRSRCGCSTTSSPPTSGAAT